MEIKLKRYVSYEPFGSKVESYSEKANSAFDESVTDDSFFVPESELIKRLNAGVTYGDALQGAYDFVDGKDTGIGVPLDRYRGLDRAEVSQALRRAEARAKESFENDIAAAQAKQAEAQTQAEVGTESVKTE